MKSIQLAVLDSALAMTMSMTRRSLAVLIGGALAVAHFGLRAQAPEKVVRVGFISISDTRRVLRAPDAECYVAQARGLGTPGGSR